MYEVYDGHHVMAHLVGLTLDAQVHDVVPADGAVVHHDVPGPQSHCVPLLHLEPLLLADLASGGPSRRHLSVTILLHPVLGWLCYLSGKR